MTLPKVEGFYYLASPYSHPDPAIRESRFGSVAWHAGSLMADGHFIFCPILQSHLPAKDFELPYEFEWWEKFNRTFIEASKGVIVADMQGWRESRGVTHEIELARTLGLPVWLHDKYGNVRTL